MTIAENLKRIHPLLAVAAVSVTLFSLVGIAAITGVLPTSQGANREASASEKQADTQSSRAVEAIPSDEVTGKKHSAKVVQTSQAARTQQTSGQGDGTESAQRSTGVAANSQTANTQVANTQTAHKPAAQNSPVGIGVGAVIGGVLGNQVGSGDGKTLATILGAVGGGYIGNEVAKKNQ
jgi:uncharacterized protein YcfJ